MSRPTTRLNKSLIQPLFTRTDGFRKSLSTLFAIFSLLILTAAFNLNASAQTTTFESPAFTTGNIHNQNGWSSPKICAMYDHLITANVGAPAVFGGQSLRISDSATSGCLDGTFSASLANEAGETSAVNNGMSGGTRQTHFEFQFSIASAVPGAEQPGLAMSVAPDRGDGARMSYLRFEDKPAGINVIFDEFIDAAPFGTTLPDNANGCSGVGDGFTDVLIATLDRTKPHSIKFVMDFVDGPRNDIVKIYIDGILTTTGNSWEDYFRYCEGNPTRTVDSLGFFTRGPANPANSGKGFLIDNILTSSGPATSTTTVYPNDLVNSPFLPAGWLFYNDENDTVNNSLGTFVAGPAAAPMGTGSAQISVSGTQRRNLATYQFSGTPLADISTLKFSTYNPTLGNGGSADRSGFLHFNVDFNGSDTWQRRLVYVPSENGTIVQNTWQEWDTINSGNAVWRYSGGNFPAPNPTATKTWNQILADYPGVRMRVTDSFLGVRVGEPYNDGYTENIDAFKFGTAAGTTQFDFEPVTPTATINQAAGQADPTSTSPVNFTVTFSEPVTGFDASDVVISGTATTTTKVVSGGPTVYNVAVTVTTSGTVIANVGAGAANAAGSGAPTAAATSTDNSVTYFTCNNVNAPTGMTALRNTVLTVPISTDDLSGRGIISFDYTFTYNSAALTPLPTPYDKSGTLSSGMEINFNSSTPGTLVISGFSTGGGDLSGSGTLIYLKFNVTGPIGTTSPLGFSSFAFNEGVPCTNTTAGSFSVISGAVTGRVTYLNYTGIGPVQGVLLSAAGTPNVSTNSAADGTYSLSGLGNSMYTVTPSKAPDALSIAAISSFDASRIAQHVVLITPFPSGGGAERSADVSGNGTITSFDAGMVARYVALLPNTGKTGTWEFDPVNRMYSIPNVETGMMNQDYAAILMGDVTGSWNSLNSPNRPSEETREEDLIRINAPKMTVDSGSEIAIPVDIRNLNRKDIISYQFELQFNPKVIRPNTNPCDVLGTVSKDLSVICNSETSGLLRVVVFGTEGLGNDGVLLNLRFTATGSAGSVSPLTFKGLLLNEGEPQSRATDGEITIPEVSKDSDSITGRLLTSKGEGIAEAEVVLTASNGETRTVYADESGYYSFDKLSVGETYLISVNSKGYIFTPQTVSAAKGMTKLDIVAGQ